jgi:hypothetical protein
MAPHGRLHTLNDAGTLTRRQPHQIRQRQPKTPERPCVAKDAERSFVYAF